MTKPNELTLAIERVEAMRYYCDNPQNQSQVFSMPLAEGDAESLRLVIEAAREGLEEAVDDTVTLSFDEALRIVTRDMHWFRRQAHGNTNPAPLKRKQAAYKMVLEAAKRPTALSGEERKTFTREELEILRDAAAWYPSEAEGCRSHESGLERYYPVAAKLDAMLEDK